MYLSTHLLLVNQSIYLSSIFYNTTLYNLLSIIYCISFYNLSTNHLALISASMYLSLIHLLICDYLSTMSYVSIICQSSTYLPSTYHLSPIISHSSITYKSSIFSLSSIYQSSILPTITTISLYFIILEVKYIYMYKTTFSCKTSCRIINSFI